MSAADKKDALDVIKEQFGKYKDEVQARAAPDQPKRETDTLLFRAQTIARVPTAASNTSKSEFFDADEFDDDAAFPMDEMSSFSAGSRRSSADTTSDGQALISNSRRASNYGATAVTSETIGLLSRELGQEESDEEPAPVLQDPFACKNELNHFEIPRRTVVQDVDIAPGYTVSWNWRLKVANTLITFDVRLLNKKGEELQIKLPPMTPELNTQMNAHQGSFRLREEAEFSKVRKVRLVFDNSGSWEWNFKYAHFVYSCEPTDTNSEIAVEVVPQMGYNETLMV
eukprot:TRINITY_DN5977_c0_g1_i6.p1 TRINITY_DN5977_c0_g1~~TRINITY_DN5977_c0_g1_i6.p1  ORF type:complete len:284 (-),score=83.21 TRINITY_DN5977_c0_g1_i6:162-1013(-)